MAFYNEFIKYGDKIFALDENGKAITYNQLDLLCKNMGAFLEKRKLVFCFCENTLECLCGYVSFLYNGVVPLMIDRHADKSLIGNLIWLYSPDFLYLHKKEADYEGYECIYEKEEYCLFKRKENSVHVLYPELALLLTTSGSTGSSKLVRQSYENIESNAQAIVQYLNLTSMERPITTLPMNYTYGLSIIHSHMAVGASVLVSNRNITDRSFWEFFKRENATSFGGVPFTYEMLKKLKFFKMELPSLRTMTQAGGKLSLLLHEEYAQYAVEHGVDFVVMYGQTEATARMAYLPADMALKKIGSIGMAIPGGRFDLIDVNGNCITTSDTVGELIYYGENVSLGYSEGVNDLALGDVNGKRLVTGDMAKFDEDGYYYIVGRKKRFLKIYGNRVNLDELEQIIKGRYEEIECACSGQDDLLEIYIEKKHEDMADEVKNYLIKVTDLNHKAFHVYIVDKIPKTLSGKTEYSRLSTLKG